MAYLAQQILNGLHIGALYALLAYGYSLGNGLLKRANLAHGALFAFGGQMAILGTGFGWNVLWLAWPAAIAAGMATALISTAFAAHVISRHVLEPLAKRAPNAVVAATLGVALVLMELGRFAFSSRDLWLPPLLAYPVVFWRDGTFAVTLTIIQLINIASALTAIFVLALFIRRSRFGANWKAVRDDPLAAQMCGVDAGQIFRKTMVLSGATAALAGILAAIHFGNISFETGLVFGLKVLFVAALGIERPPLVAAYGAAFVGLGEALWSGYFPVEWRDVAVFSALAALIVFRPGRSLDDLGAGRNDHS